MARLYTCAFEFGHVQAEGLLVSGSPTFDTAQKHTGTRSLKVAAAGTDTYVKRANVFTSGRAYFVRDYWRCEDLPTGTDKAYICSIPGVGEVRWFDVRVRSNGEIGVSTTTGEQVSTNGIIVPDTWYRIEVKFTYNSGGADTYEIKVDGVTVIGPITETVFENQPLEWAFGQFDSTASGVDIWHDDVAINDDQGADQNSWPGAGNVYYLKPVADPGTSSANWTKPGGGTTNRHTSVDNVPPVYEAYDSASPSAEDYLRNAISGATAELQLDLDSYTAAGVDPAATIRVVQPVANVGSSSATDTAGSIGINSNPTIALLAFTAYDNGVASTTPSTWPRVEGTITYNPSVTRGTQPRMAMRKTTPTTRVGIVNAMALIVDAEPGVPVVGFPTPPLSRRFQHLLVR